jgi:hypothetical protein
MGSAEVVQLLVAAGADKNVQDKVSAREGVMYVVASL